jgi:hypothetical protein
MTSRRMRSEGDFTRVIGSGENAYLMQCTDGLFAGGASRSASLKIAEFATTEVMRTGGERLRGETLCSRGLVV